MSKIRSIKRPKKGYRKQDLPLIDQEENGKGKGINKVWLGRIKHQEAITRQYRLERV